MSILGLSEGYGPILIGMRGSGKSSVAPRLAERLGLSVLDADVEIERRAGRRIAEIFAQQGEAAFRRLEQELLTKDLLQRREAVLATGGGAVLDAEVRATMNTRFTVWLHAPVEVLAARIGGSDRPSLTGRPIDEELAQVLATRQVLYREAAHVIINADQPVETIVEAIAEAAHHEQGEGSS